uniref:F-box domain-containing protein n=1 Tax=Rhabditophanes sp. KR3021 TaxID=114890 RepID=A0AC35TGI0_9BILA
MDSISSKETVLNCYDLMKTILSYVDTLKDRFAFELTSKWNRFYSLSTIMPSLYFRYLDKSLTVKIEDSFDEDTVTLSIGEDTKFRMVLDKELIKTDKDTKLKLTGYLSRFLLHTRKVVIELKDDNCKRDSENDMWLDTLVVDIISKFKWTLEEITLTPIVYPIRKEDHRQKILRLFKILHKLSTKINLNVEIKWFDGTKDDNKNKLFDFFCLLPRQLNVASVVISPKDTQKQCATQNWFNLYFDIKALNLANLKKAVLLIDCRCHCCSLTIAKIFQFILKDPHLNDLSLNFSPFNHLNPNLLFSVMTEKITTLHMLIFMDRFDARGCLELLEERCPMIEELELQHNDCFNNIMPSLFLNSFPSLKSLKVYEEMAMFSTRLANYLYKSTFINLKFLQFQTAFETRAFTKFKLLKSRFKYALMDPESNECIILGFNYADDEWQLNRYNSNNN